MMKITKTSLFFIALILGLIIGNFFTANYGNAYKSGVAENLDHVKSILIETKLKSNEDSIWCGQQIEKLSDLLYESKTENQELKKRLGIAGKP